jgi:hypothetical protein
VSNNVRKIAEEIARLTGRTVKVVRFSSLPSTELPTTIPEIGKSINDFYSCIDSVVTVGPSETEDVMAMNCYECDKPVNYLFPDGRCGACTRLTPEEMTGAE